MDNLGKRPAWVETRRPRAVSAWEHIAEDHWRTMRSDAMPMTREDYQNTTAYYHMAYLNVVKGSASEESWNMLAVGTNMVLILAELGYGEEHIEMIQQAQDALMRADDRGKRTGTWRMDGPGIGLLGDMLAVLDIQLEMATRGEILQARDIIMERMANQEAEAANLQQA